METKPDSKRVGLGICKLPLEKHNITNAAFIRTNCSFDNEKMIP